MAASWMGWGALGLMLIATTVGSAQDRTDARTPAGLASEVGQGTVAAGALLAVAAPGTRDAARPAGAPGWEPAASLAPAGAGMTRDAASELRREPARPVDGASSSSPAGAAAVPPAPTPSVPVALEDLSAKASPEGGLIAGDGDR